ncbi:hypothetical protein LTR62_002013 [Meristemomyces frigidus]|uniref:PHD-type domain-containing protein n=1 Tax=Meristemomyces frigidus TaxID=1508187 RepID=A0AAN7YHR4_9PEZI|nr:hypothetical protein LTR62_002013 [Meristemomyces frigidus]
MPRYGKRTAEVAELDLPTTPAVAPEHVETLHKLRNMWEFASFMQYVFLFGHIVKIDDDFDIEDLEAECLKSDPSPRLAAIGLSLLKYVSSHRGLTPEIFDEYTRRQYLAKAPARNPFGDDEDPLSFQTLDIYTRVRILQQLSTWTLGNAERIRGIMPQDDDHLTWRMEPLGWDRDESAYHVLDDNRLYKRCDKPPPPPSPQVKPKAKSKAKPKKSTKSKGTRSSKRRKVEEEEEDEQMDQADADTTLDAQDDTVMTNGNDEHKLSLEEEPAYGFTDKTWSLVAITLDEYDDFLSSIFRSRDANEKALHRRIYEDVRPVIEKRAEAVRQKELKKLRELEVVQKLATAKRSSRLAGRFEKEKEEREKQEAEQQHQRELQMAHEEEERQKRIEEGHESRRQTREQRVKEREVKRILHEEELKKLQEAEERGISASLEPETADAEHKRASVRQAQTQKEQHKKELEQLNAEIEDKWYFDCAVCGMHGENIDDGSHSMSCDKCEVWQHSKCHGFSPAQAEKKGFTFVCKSCRRLEADKDKPKIPPLKLGRKTPSANPASPQKRKRSSGSAGRPSTGNGVPTGNLPDHVQRQLDGVHTHPQPRPSPGPFGQLTKGPSLSPHGQAQGPPGYRYPPVGNYAPNAPPQQPWQGSPFPPPNRPSSSGHSGSPPPPQPATNGYGQPRHQQQQQHAHQQAVHTAGGHPGQHVPQNQPHANGYHPQIQRGQPPRAAQPHYQPAHHYYQPAPPPMYYPAARAGSGQMPPHHQQPQHANVNYPPQAPPQPLINGFESPNKFAAPPAMSPPSATPQHTKQPSHPPQSSPIIQRSPQTTLPPPIDDHQYAGHSPMKSSPPHHQPLPPQAYQRPLQPAHLAMTPQQQPTVTARPTSSNGIVADGMSGPWPAGSKAIPQKHDLPPSSSPIVGDSKILPPPNAVMPSPSTAQNPSNVSTVIPVKKLVPGNDGEVPNGSPLQSTPLVATSLAHAQGNAKPR